MKTEAPIAQGWIDRFKQALSIIAILAAVLSAGVGILTAWLADSGERTARFAITNAEREQNLARYNLELQDVIFRVKNLEQHISSISTVPKEDTLYIELQKLTTTVDELKNKQAKIESVILENPAKALEIPLLRRDINGVKEVQQAAIVSIKDSVDRVYDINKWLLGAMAVSVVTLAAGNLLKSKETKS